MFAGLLNKGFRGGLALVITLLALTFLANYLAVRSLEENNYPNLFYNYFAARISNHFLVTLCNYLIIALGAFLISLISTSQEIVEKVNYFPVFLFVLLSAASANPQHITPHLLTNVFILFSMYKLLDTYREEYAIRRIFDAAFWLCVSFFISISGVVYGLLFFIILFILRPFSWRDWLSALLGFLMPVYIYECMAYLSNFNQGYLFKALGSYFTSLRFPSVSEYYIALLVILFLLLLAAILHGLSRGFGNTVKKQKAKQVLLWFTAFATVAFFSGGATGAGIVATYALPLSFLIGDFLFNLKQIKIANTILTIIILSVLIIFWAQFGWI